MEENQSAEPRKIQFQEMVDASQYVQGYLKFIGLDPATDFPDEPEKDWPEDVKKALETYNLFYKQNEDIIF